MNSDYYKELLEHFCDKRVGELLDGTWGGDLMRRFTKLPVTLCMDPFTTRSAEESSWMSDWKMLSPRLLAGKDLGDLLVRYHSVLREQDQHHPPAINFLISGFEPIYELGGSYALAWNPDEGEKILCYVFGRDDGEIKPADVVWALARSEAGRTEVLYPALSQLVEKIRKEAGEGFDKACLVTADGKKAIPATRVYIVHSDGRRSEHSGSCFLRHKIVRENAGQGETSSGPGDVEEKDLDYWEPRVQSARGPGHVYIKSITSEERVLMIHATLLQSPEFKVNRHTTEKIIVVEVHGNFVGEKASNALSRKIEALMTNFVRRNEWTHFLLNLEDANCIDEWAAKRLHQDQDMLSGKGLKFALCSLQNIEPGPGKEALLNHFECFDNEEAARLSLA